MARWCELGRGGAKSVDIVCEARFGRIYVATGGQRRAASLEASVLRAEYERGPDGRKLVAPVDDENAGLAPGMIVFDRVYDKCINGAKG